MSSAEAAGSSPVDPATFVTLRMSLAVHVDSALAPDAEQAIQTCLDTLSALGAVIAPSEIETPSPKVADKPQSSEALSDQQQIWQEMLAKNRRACQERYSLTDREVEVLRLAGDGLSNAEIGYALTLSRHTIKSHLQRAGFKMGTGDRWGMVALFNGTFTPDSKPNHL